VAEVNVATKFYTHLNSKFLMNFLIIIDRDLLRIIKNCPLFLKIPFVQLSICYVIEIKKVRRNIPPANVLICSTSATKI
jgi:hypothetical protein